MMKHKPFAQLFFAAIFALAVNAAGQVNMSLYALI
jgi:hypothetical protein